MLVFEETEMEQKGERDNPAAAALAVLLKPKDSRDQVRTTIIFKEDIYREMLGYCLKDSNERGCFILGGTSLSGGAREIYAERLYIPPDSEYKERRGAFVRIRAEYLLRMLDEYEFSDATAMIDVHSHPFAYGGVGFSSIDVKSFHETVSYCLLRKKGTYASLVLGQDGVFEGMFATTHGQLEKNVSLKVICRDGIRRMPEAGGILEAERLDRQIPLFGEAGQRRIAATRLAVVGVGGVGSCFAIKAARYGLQDITVIDHDVVEESNLNRLAGAGWKDVGERKVNVARRSIETISRFALCKAVSLPVQDATDELKGADVVASCVDSDEVRLFLQEFCARYYKPLIDFGAGGQVKGELIVDLGSHARLYVPGMACICCMGLDPTGIQSDSLLENRRLAGYIDGLDHTPVQVESTNSIAASLGIDMLARYLSGQGVESNFIHYDAVKQRMTGVMFIGDETCPICGKQGIEGSGDVPDAVEGFMPTTVREMMAAQRPVSVIRKRRKRSPYFAGVEWWMRRRAKMM